ncbi:tripartite tricarboxylate transporter TctB family protein [Bhargavaea massiliensis]|uniref:tripartite tricarboxylate transporter TctB family protein n=1 Tax=Bhargavaea massiliensis TaxID=2697500 RepID=UPI001BCF4F5B|nr:tripartite tricarboxylate transporter TctB family protein [Bhargavaea massiliensis]
MSKTFDRYAGIIFLVIGLVFVMEARKISHSAYGSSVGPDIFPTGLGILLILLSARLIYETFKYKGEEGKKEPVQYKRFLVIFLSAVAYAFLLEKLGYVASTFLFLIVAFQAMERGSWIKTLIIAAVFSFGVYYFFSELLGGALPGFPGL